MVFLRRMTAIEPSPETQCSILPNEPTNAADVEETAGLANPKTTADEPTEPTSWTLVRSPLIGGKKSTQLDSLRPVVAF
jgi:hypothetical protein